MMNTGLLSLVQYQRLYQDGNGGDSAAISADEIAVNAGYLLESVNYFMIKTYNVAEDTAILRIKILSIKIRLFSLLFIWQITKIGISFMILGL